MKKNLLLLASVFVLSGPIAVYAQDEEVLRSEIESLEMQLKEKKEELAQLTGEEVTKGIGDTVEVNGIEYTLTDVYLSDELNSTTDTKADRVLVVEFNVINNSNEEAFAFQVTETYGDDTKLEVYPYVPSVSETIQPSKKANIIEGHALIGEPEKIEIQVKDHFAGDLADEVFIVNFEDIQ